jgi:hypothetical protein
MKKTIIRIAASLALSFSAYAEKNKHNKSSQKNSSHSERSHTKPQKQSSHSERSHTNSHKHSSHSKRTHTNLHKRTTHHQGHIGHKSYPYNKVRVYSNHGSYRSSSHSNGYYEYVNKKVWIPKVCKKVWVPAKYEYHRNHCGKFVRVIVSNGYHHSHVTPGYYDYQTVKVWRDVHCSTRNTVSIHWGR